MVGILVAMFVLDKWLALASLLVVPIMFWFTQFVARYTRRGFRDLQKDLGELNAVMEESISGQKVITAFRRNDYRGRAFREHNEAVFRAGVYGQQLRALADAAHERARQLLRDRAWPGWAACLRLRGLVSVGIDRHLHHLRPELHQPARASWPTCTTRSRPRWPGRSVSSRSSTRLRRSTRPRLPRRSSAIRGDVRFEHVDFGYRPDQQVIKDMSLHAHAGRDRSPWSDRPAPARRRSSTCSRASTRSTTAASRSTARDIPRHPQGRPAPPARARAAGHVPVFRQRAGQHPLRPAGRDGRRGDRGRRDGRRRPFHPPAARRATRRCSPSAPAT